MIDQNRFFRFEMDFVEGLRCIPMIVRYRLDCVGIKLKLHHWNQLSVSERLALVDHPFESDDDRLDYRQQLRQWVEARSGEFPSDLPVEASPLWTELAVPSVVQQKAASQRVEITNQQWQTLSLLQRFALIKLSKIGHENQNFLPALREFGLL